MYVIRIFCGGSRGDCKINVGVQKTKSRYLLKFARGQLFFINFAGTKNSDQTTKTPFPTISMLRCGVGQLPNCSKTCVVFILSSAHLLLVNYHAPDCRSAPEILSNYIIFPTIGVFFKKALNN